MITKKTALAAFAACLGFFLVIPVLIGVLYVLASAPISITSDECKKLFMKYMHFSLSDETQVLFSERGSNRDAMLFRIQLKLSEVDSKKMFESTDSLWEVDALSENCKKDIMSIFNVYWSDDQITKHVELLLDRDIGIPSFIYSNNNVDVCAVFDPAAEVVLFLVREDHGI